MPRPLPRPPGDLGLRHTAAPRLLPWLAAGMALLAALAGAGALAANTLAARWAGAATNAGTVQVPQPDAPAATSPTVTSPTVTSPGATHTATRAAAVASILGPAARQLTTAEAIALLRPWLGPAAQSLAPSLPAIFTLAPTTTTPQAPTTLAPTTLASIDRAAPGTIVLQTDPWQATLATLARSLRLCAALALATVAAIAAATVTLATRASLDARRETLAIVHSLGATDATIAARIAAPITRTAAIGAACGTIAALPALLWLACLMPDTAPPHVALPAAPWLLLAAIPPAAAAIAWLTAQLSVRAWLAQLA